MAGRTKLYRLLRDDENPLDEGIKAKLPNEHKTPLQHIGHGSRQNSQWISTSRNLSDLDKLIRYKKKKQGRSIRCRIVEIDEQKLQQYAQTKNIIRQFIIYLNMKITEENEEKILKSISHSLEETTGQILDFTDQTVMDKHIPSYPSYSFGLNEKARGYARKYSEVLVERFIPADCCIRICKR